jgi:hypothetical protein
MNSSKQEIERLKFKLGTNLEDLSIEDRYAAIAILAIAVNRQMFPFQVAANDQSVLDRFCNKDVYGIIQYSHVAAIPGIIKFLAESIPGSF